MALPDVQHTATGSFLIVAIPNAENAADRSSTIISILNSGLRSKAANSGKFLDPGDPITYLMPFSDNIRVIMAEQLAEFIDINAIGYVSV